MSNDNASDRELAQLFEKNEKWAAGMERHHPGFFSRLLTQQTPQYLWIGCADSRVPANELVGLLPGDVFVHRNVANVVAHSDLNALSVIQYAVDALKVRHIIVVGHSKCGGVTAALNNTRVGVVDNWLRHVQDVRNVHGWVYGLHNGLLEDLSFTVNSMDDVAPAYQRALFALRVRHLPASVPMPLQEDRG
jgi:carbonic anhydrase